MSLPKPTLVATSLKSGGAARAAARWVECLETTEKIVGDNLHSRKSIKIVIYRKIERIFFFFWDAGQLGAPSTSLVGYGDKECLKARNSQVLFFIHWVQGGFLSIKTLRRISRSSVFYAHDEWLISGLGHYHASKLNVFFKTVDWCLRKYKKKILQNARLVLAPSLWLTHKIRSITEGKIRVEQLENPVDPSFFSDYDQDEIRIKVGLSPEKKYVLIISDSNSTDLRKGADLAADALNLLQKFYPEFEILLCGKTNRNIFANFSVIDLVAGFEYRIASYEAKDAYT